MPRATAQNPVRPDDPGARAYRIDWGALAPLRLRARAVAEGIYSGAHRSVRKGSGVEFGGQRPYVPGDDLRFFDRRSLLRHDKLMVREFETETDRALWLVFDATASMSFRSADAPGAKLAYAAVIGAALARVALASGDPVGLAFVGGEHTQGLPPLAGREAFDRLCGALEQAEAMGDATRDLETVRRALGPVARKARRGAVVVLLSDLYDLPDGSLHAFASLAPRGRALVALQVLDPAEARLSFEGNVRLRALEGGAVVETDADAVRSAYLERMNAIADGWSRELAARGGRLVRATTDEPGVDVLRRVLLAAAEARR